MMSSESELISPSTLSDVQSACAEQIMHAHRFFEAACLANEGSIEQASSLLAEVAEMSEDQRLLFMAFQFYFRTGELAKARGITVRRLELAQREGVAEIQARALCNLGLICLTQGDHVQAKEFGDQALVLDERLGNQMGIARDLGHLANVFEAMGDFERAEALNVRGLSVATSIGAHEMAAGKLANLGDIALAKGKPQEARRLWQHAVDLFERVGVRKWHSQLNEKLRSVPADRSQGE